MLENASRTGDPRPGPMPPAGFTPSRRPSRRFFKPQRDASPSLSSIRAADLLWIAPWLGVMTGLVELVARFARDRLFGRVMVDMLRTNHHALWMIVVSNAVLIGLVGLIVGSLGLLLGVVFRSDRARRRIAAVGLWVVMIPCFLGPLLVSRSLAAWASLALGAGLAAKAARWLAPRVRALRRVVVGSMPAVIVGLGVCVPMLARHIDGAEGRALAALPAARPGAPNVVLLVLDTVRADALSLHGASRLTTPRIDAMARRGLWFRHARATAPWTLPSHGSLFTGRWPHEMSIRIDRPFDGAFPTLAEAFRDRGYATAASVANTYYVNAMYGLDRGFVRYVDHPENHEVNAAEVVHASALGHHLFELSKESKPPWPWIYTRPKPASAVNAEALAWVDAQRAAGRPFFLFLNYFDAHGPYVLPPDATPRFGSPPPGRSGEIKREIGGLKKQLRLRPDDAALVATIAAREAELARLQRDAYDNCLAYIDEQVGRLMDELGRRGLDDETIVLLTSDHGEHFGEHGLFGHGHSLYRPVLDVPLVIVAPPALGMPAGLAVDEPVSLRDVPATLLGLAGLGESAGLPGASLARFWTDGVPSNGTVGEPPLSEVEHQTKYPPTPSVPASLGSMRAVVAGGKILIHHDATGADQLFELGGDPAEARDLAADPSRAGDLARSRTALEAVGGPIPQPSRARR